MSLSSALLSPIAGWRLVIQSRSDWLLLTIWTFCLDNLQCLFDCLHIGLKGRAPCAGQCGIRMVNCMITLGADSDQNASSAY